MTIKERVIDQLQHTSGLSDRELTDLIFGKDKPQQTINGACRQLERERVLVRAPRRDGIIGSILVGGDPPVLIQPVPDEKQHLEMPASEDEIKRLLKQWLEDQGWDVAVAWGHERGVDISARRDGETWLIEVKGSGSRSAMRVNYFLAALGKTFQRMQSSEAKYSVAFPSMKQFRNLWVRLPEVAKLRTGITAIFVDANGRVEEAS